jgi:hypothetical protein
VPMKLQAVPMKLQAVPMTLQAVPMTLTMTLTMAHQQWHSANDKTDGPYRGCTHAGGGGVQPIQPIQPILQHAAPVLWSTHSTISICFGEQHASRHYYGVTTNRQYHSPIANCQAGPVYCISADMSPLPARWTKTGVCSHHHLSKQGKQRQRMCGRRAEDEWPQGQGMGGRKVRGWAAARAEDEWPQGQRMSGRKPPQGQRRSGRKAGERQTETKVSS